MCVCVCVCVCTKCNFILVGLSMRKELSDRIIDNRLHGRRHGRRHLLDVIIRPVRPEVGDVGVLLVAKRAAVWTSVGGQHRHIYGRTILYRSSKHGE